MVVSKIFCVHPYLGRSPNLTSIAYFSDALVQPPTSTQVGAHLSFLIWFLVDKQPERIQRQMLPSSMWQVARGSTGLVLCFWFGQRVVIGWWFEGGSVKEKHFLHLGFVCFLFEPLWVRVMGYRLPFFWYIQEVRKSNKDIKLVNSSHFLFKVIVHCHQKMKRCLFVLPCLPRSFRWRKDFETLKIEEDVQVDYTSLKLSAKAPMKIPMGFCWCKPPFGKAFFSGATPKINMEPTNPDPQKWRNHHLPTHPMFQVRTGC